MDEGRHPESLTYDIFHRTQLANQESKGRVEAMRHIRDALMKEALLQFRESAVDYLQLTGQDPQAVIDLLEAGTTGEAAPAAPGQGTGFAHGQISMQMAAHAAHAQANAANQAQMKKNM